MVKIKSIKIVLFSFFISVVVSPKVLAYCENGPNECGGTNLPYCTCAEYCYQHCCVPDPTPSCGIPGDPGDPWSPGDPGDPYIPPDVDPCDEITCRPTNCNDDEIGHGTGYPCGSWMICTPNCPEPTDCTGEDNTIKGRFDGVSCNNSCEMVVSGWACDSDSYISKLTAKIKASGVYVGSDVADLVLGDDAAVAAQCGGFGGHRFYFASDVSFQPNASYDVGVDIVGYNSVGLKSLNNGTDWDCIASVECGNCTPCTPVDGVLSDWSTCNCPAGTQTATCDNPEPACGGSVCDGECAGSGGSYDLDSGVCTIPCSCCTVNQGTPSAWGECVNGKQTRTCTGFTCCGSTCGNCGGEILERDCLRIDGNIWSDDDKDGKELSDYWKKDSNTPFGCGNNNKTYPGFYMTISGETSPLNQISGWFCHDEGYGVFYNTPVPNAIEPESSKTVKLTSIPVGYDVVGWDYRNGLGIGQTSGSGSETSPLLMPSASWVNVNWELEQQTYNLTIKVKDIPPETLVEYSGDSCTLDLSVLDNLSDATVIISSATGAELCNKTTDSNGEVTCDIWVNQGDLNITVRKRVSDEEVIRTYSMVCPSKGSYPYNPGVVADGDSKTELVGLKESYKESWVSAVDSDIFAKEVNVVVPLGTGSNPAGFVKALLNSYDNITGGFVFSKDQITNPHEDTLDEGTTYNLLFEDDLGGRAENLDSGGSNHNSKWLESFTFEAPNGATEISDLNTSLNSGVIYKSSGITTLPNTYTLSGTGVAVLYIDNDLTINNNFTTSSNGRLLLVVNGSVTISKDVGTDVGSFRLSQDPNIEAGIIASGKIEFESIGGSIAEDSHDDPIMVSAPLITRDLTDGIIFSRDLYTDNNVTTPAESAKSFNKYLYLLSSLEREKSQDNLYFTGLTTYDLDWEYIY